MEVKATLNKPYTNTQRLDFIVEQNHRNGYVIKETPQALEAWGKTAEEIADEEKQAQIRDIMSQLDNLDLKAIRSMRAINAGTGTEADTQKLAEIEAEAQELRSQLEELRG